MRGCGGADDLAVTGYHAGQTSDLLAFLRERRRTEFLADFRDRILAGRKCGPQAGGGTGDDAGELLAGVCAVSTPIDLAACVAALGRPQNFIYQNRFLDRLKDRIRRKNRQSPDVYTLEHLPKIRTIEDFDDHYTARLFGFGTAANYFRTQSSNQFLERIRVPDAGGAVQGRSHWSRSRSLTIRRFGKNPCLTLLAVEHGGHLGFLARGKARFWLDGMVLDWTEGSLWEQCELALRTSYPRR